MSNYQRLVHYTKQLASHVNNRRHHEAVSLFASLRSSSISLDPFVFPLALKSCSALCLPRLVAAIHAHTTAVGFSSNPFVASALIDAYGKVCLSLPSARKVFDESPERNVVVWNAMISLYAHAGDVRRALELFESMDVVPNASTYNSIIAALLESADLGSNKALGFYRRMICSGIKPNLITVLALLPACISLNLVKEIQGFGLRHGFMDCQLGSALVEAYGKRGALAYARKLFDSLRYRDVVAWSSMVSAYALHGEAQCAMDMFRRMDASNVRPDGIMFLAVLKACSHAGLPEEALRYFGMMNEHYGLVPGSDHYGCLVDVLSRSGRLHDAYKVITEMPVKPTATAWGALLGACRSYANVKLAEIAGKMLFEIEPENAGNFVILANIYANAGMFEKAEGVRKEMKERLVKRAPGSSWVS